MDAELVPIFKCFINLFKSLIIVFIEWDLLPKIFRFLGSLSGLHVEITDTLFLFDGGILGVS